MEAAAMEIPVITSNNRGCREVVADGQSGFLCQPGDPFDLAGKMEKMLLLSGEERKQMGVKGRRLVNSSFGIHKIIAEYRAVIESIHGPQPTPDPS